VSCSSGCPTQDHANWGECVRLKRIETSGVEAYLQNRRIYSASDAYRKAREDGLQPEGVTHAQVEAAYRTSDVIGKPYRADEVAGF
jgi:hypothetical protein